MSEDTKKPIDRRYLYCLRCKKPQDKLSVHLARVCMKKCTPEERAVELEKAKESTKKWTLTRNWEYSHICELLPHAECRSAMVNELLERGFFISNIPPEPILVSSAEDISAEEPGTSESTTNKCIASPNPSSQDEDSCSSASSKDVGPVDPSWQKYV